MSGFSTVAIAQGNLTIRVNETPLGVPCLVHSRKDGRRWCRAPGISVDTGADHKLGILNSAPTPARPSSAG